MLTAECRGDDAGLAEAAGFAARFHVRDFHAGRVADFLLGRHHRAPDAPVGRLQDCFPGLEFGAINGGVGALAGLVHALAGSFLRDSVGGGGDRGGEQCGGDERCRECGAKGQHWHRAWSSKCFRITRSAKGTLQAGATRFDGVYPRDDDLASVRGEFCRIASWALQFCSRAGVAAGSGGTGDEKSAAHVPETRLTRFQI